MMAYNSDEVGSIHCAATETTPLYVAPVAAFLIAFTGNEICKPLVREIFPPALAVNVPAIFFLNNFRRKKTDFPSSAIKVLMPLK